MLTGYEQIDLEGTGVIQAYFDAILSVVAASVCEHLWSVTDAIFQQYGSDPTALEEAVRQQILADAVLGPVARNIISLWYLSTWNSMKDWSGEYAPNARQDSFVVSAAAYKEGLLWRAIGSHPPGAKQPGFGSWSRPPVIEEVEGWRKEVDDRETV